MINNPRMVSDKDNFLEVGLFDPVVELATDFRSAHAHLWCYSSTRYHDIKLGRLQIVIFGGKQAILVFLGVLII